MFAVELHSCAVPFALLHVSLTFEACYEKKPYKVKAIKHYSIDVFFQPIRTQYFYGAYSEQASERIIFLSAIRRAVFTNPPERTFCTYFSTS